jgi:hypothetical protein
MSEPAITPERAEALLAIPPAETAGDDLESMLAARRPTRRLPPLTTILGALVLLAAGTAGGAWAQKRWGDSSSNGGRAGAFAALAANRAGRTGATGATSGAFGARGGFGNATVGTVRLVDGKTLYVATSGGGVATVKTSATTTVRVTKSARLGTLKPGQTVIVQGTTGKDGSVAATSISQATAGGLGGRGGFGAAPTGGAPGGG